MGAKTLTANSFQKRVHFEGAANKSALKDNYETQLHIRAYQYINGRQRTPTAATEKLTDTKDIYPQRFLRAFQQVPADSLGCLEPLLPVGRLGVVVGANDYDVEALNLVHLPHILLKHRLDVIAGHDWIRSCREEQVFDNLQNRCDDRDKVVPSKTENGWFVSMFKQRAIA